MARKKKYSRLKVLSNGNLVGNLTRTQLGTLEFQYAQEWLDSPNAMPISYSLPLRESPYRELKVQAYFDNLLPDNDAIRTKIAERFGAEGKNPFDLLASIGRDCVGALQFVPENESGGVGNEIQGEPLKDTEIANILKNLKISPLGLDRSREFRISLAGAQEKTALLKWNEKWHRPLGVTATTHIFKPQIGVLPNGIDLSSSVENEWLCLRICEFFGLPVAQTEILDFDGLRCLVVERFDRAWSTDRRHLHRIPQEDLCQALGASWTQKYQQEGGPGIVQVMDFLNSSDLRDQDRAQFMRTQLVFFLLAAIDGHAKNFSITLLPTGFKLTPLYDVVSALPALSARQIESKEVELAMAIGDHRHYKIREVIRRHWEQTAKKVGFPLSELQNIIDDLLRRGEQIDSFISDLGKKHSIKFFGSIIEGIQNGLKKIQ